MAEIWQQAVVVLVVLAAVFYLVSRSRKSGCEKGDCGCEGKKIADKLGAQRPQGGTRKV